MTTRTFGIALPAKYDDVKPGMLVSAASQSGKRVIGLAFQGDREILVAVFAQDGDEPPLPYVIDLSDIHQTLTVIPGVREFEPARETSFDLLPNRRSGTEGFVITATGKVGLAVTYRNFGMPQALILDFDTGAGLVHGGSWAMIPTPRIFIREEGRDVSRELSIQPSS